MMPIAGPAIAGLNGSLLQLQSEMISVPGFAFRWTKKNECLMILAPALRTMAETKKDEGDCEKKRVIEFDMFVRDLDPKTDEKVRGGNRSRPDEQQNSK